MSRKRVWSDEFNQWVTIDSSFNKETGGIVPPSLDDNNILTGMGWKQLVKLDGDVVSVPIEFITENNVITKIKLNGIEYKFAGDSPSPSEETTCILGMEKLDKMILD